MSLCTIRVTKLVRQMRRHSHHTSVSLTGSRYNTADVILQM